MSGYCNYTIQKLQDLTTFLKAHLGKPLAVCVACVSLLWYLWRIKLEFSPTQKLARITNETRPLAYKSVLSSGPILSSPEQVFLEEQLLISL
jgi:hypothetical protein